MDTPRQQQGLLGTARDLARSKAQMVLENALLRQQLIVLQRRVKRPTLTWRDRALFVLLASKLPGWKRALMIVQPEQRGLRRRPVLAGNPYLFENLSL